jgi:hypothetical protein
MMSLTVKLDEPSSSASASSANAAPISVVENSKASTSICTNGTSYAKIVLRPKDENEKMSSNTNGNFGAEKGTTNVGDVVSKNRSSSRSSNVEGVPHQRGSSSKQDQPSHSQSQQRSDKQVRPESPSDDFEMVVRKTRPSNGNSNNGPKFRKGRGDADSPSKSRDFDTRRYGRRRYYPDREKSSNLPDNDSSAGDKTDGSPANVNGNQSSSRVSTRSQNGQTVSNGKSPATTSLPVEHNLETNDNGNALNGNTDSSSNDGTNNGEGQDHLSNQELSKPQFVLAPPPKVNPWFVKPKMTAPVNPKVGSTSTIAQSTRETSSHAKKNPRPPVSSVSEASKDSGKQNPKTSQPSAKSNGNQAQGNAKQAQSAPGKLPLGNLENQTQPQSDASPRSDGMLTDVFFSTSA